MKKKTTKSRFRGSSDHVLDAKGRLNIPSRFKKVLSEQYSEDLVVTRWESCLKIYPAECWEVQEDKLLEKAEANPELERHIRYVVGGVTECTLDKQGRILLPAVERKRFHIAKKVVLQGMVDHFEVWDQEAWQRETDSAQQDFGAYRASMATQQNGT